MLVAIDYDDTFTLDPVAWRRVMEALWNGGHDVICVTGRRHKPDFTREPFIPCEVFCTDGEAKRRYMARKGYSVDVWIDDIPAIIDTDAKAMWDLPDQVQPSPGKQGD